MQFTTKFAKRAVVLAVLALALSLGSAYVGAKLVLAQASPQMPNNSILHMIDGSDPKPCPNC